MHATSAREVLNRTLVRRLLRDGRPLGTPLGRIIIGPPHAERQPRTLVVVGKAVSKKSVVRNRAKRRIAAWAREERLASRYARSMVILVAPSVATTNRAAFRMAAHQARALITSALSRPALPSSR